MYALVQNDAIVEHGPLPDVWNDGTRDWDLRPMTDPELADLGWLPVMELPRPEDTTTTTYDYSVQLVDGKPTTVWTERSKTQGELDSDESEANTDEMTTESDLSVDKLVAVISALNAITDMTNANINANPAAVIKTLTRECKTIARQVNREARLTSGRTESTDTGPVTDV
jgi:hypothetical protein